MLRTKIPTQMAGVYLYHAGKQVYLDEVGRELVIVLVSAAKGVAGVVVYPDSFVRGQLFELLSTLKEKICTELSVEASTLSAKIFGCSSGQTNALFAAQIWLTDKGIRIEALDTGRNVTRNIVVDSKSGKVGVRFADAQNVLGAGFLKTGTAAHRSDGSGTAPGTSTCAVVLVTDNKSFELLAGQSLENRPGWTVATFSSKELLKAPKKLRNQWLKTTTVVIVLEDVLDTSDLAKAIIALKKKAPSIRWLWSVSDGTEVPLPLDAVPLPSADAPSTFGDNVAQALALPLNNGGTVIELSSRRARNK